MTSMQEKAFEMIKRLPDDKVYFVVQLLEGMEGLLPQSMTGKKSPEQKAYEELQQFRKCATEEVDYRAELTQAREKKYAGVD